MKEILDIKTIHHQIERLRPIWKKIETEIDENIKDPQFAEFVVRTNEKEKYFLLIINEMIDMYDAYLEITSKIISQEPIKKISIEKPSIPTTDEEDDFEENEEGINDSEEEGIIARSGKLDISDRPKPKIGRRPKIPPQG